MYPNEAVWSYALRQNSTYLLIGLYLLIALVQRMLKSDTRTRWGILMMVGATLVALTFAESWFEVGTGPLELHFWSHIKPPLWSIASDFPFSLIGVSLIYLGYVFWRRVLD